MDLSRFLKGLEKIQIVENVGDVVQSILVHEDDLFVAVNNSHTIKKYDITDSGLALPGIEISTNNSGPRGKCVWLTINYILQTGIQKTLRYWIYTIII